MIRVAGDGPRTRTVWPFTGATGSSFARRRDACAVRQLDRLRLDPDDVDAGPDGLAETRHESVGRAPRIDLCVGVEKHAACAVGRDPGLERTAGVAVEALAVELGLLVAEQEGE
jgi:hypothetical protein